MASYAAIAATSQAVIGLLAAADPGFGTVAFSIGTLADLQAPLSDHLTAALYLYHVAVDVGL